MSDYDAIVLDLDGDAAMLRACVDSLLQQDVPPRRVIVVDNGSVRPTAQRLPDIAIDIVRLDENRGFAGGANEGLRRSDAPFVALVNNDVVLAKAWGEELLRAMESDDHCAAVQSILLTADGRQVDGAGIALQRGRILQLGHGENIDDVHLDDFWGVSATATLYRRAALQRAGAGAFDERFFAYYEDVELVARLLGNGWTTRLVARPLATHRGSATASRLGRRATFIRTRNRYFVARLHPGVARVSALLLEDLRRVARGATRFQIAQIATIVAGACAGLFRRLR